ncbi:MAG TPA: ATP phosphoribosyltransferase [Polyangiaceae bacterium]|jgi:ATP phosphoribosyltransferase
MLVVALSKGRTVHALVPLLARAGIDASALTANDRSLIRDVGELRFLMLKPDDVPTYVEHGAADLGIVGRDVLRERESDLLVPLDLGIGRCKMVVAAPVGAPPNVDMPRVATKYPRTAAAWFASRRVQAEIITLSGSVELAPLVGLADSIVDLVETGETLRQNGLEIVAEAQSVSTVVAVNRAAYKLRRSEIGALIERLAAAAHATPPSPA